jgi:methane monooxygenase component C
VLVALCDQDQKIAASARRSTGGCNLRSKDKIMYQITAITEDEHEVSFECSPDEDIVSAGVRNNVILLASCHEGGCATCKADCIDGDYELGRCSVQALPPDEEEAGVVLLCQTYPRDDLVVRLPYAFERISFNTVKSDWQGVISSVRKLSSNVVELKIDPTDADNGEAVKIPFYAGQYLDIEIPGVGVSRSYSMASVDDDRQLTFLIRLLPDGRFSQFLSAQAKPGLLLRLRGPFGAFSIRENGLRPRYFVAGGTGLSPVLSMVRYMQREGHPQETKLFFGITHQHELFYLDELKKLETEMPNLRIFVSVAKPDPDWHGSTGTAIDELAKHLQATSTRPDIYLCGPPAMIDAAFATAATFGVAKDQIYMEKFLASGSMQQENGDTSRAVSA